MIRSRLSGVLGALLLGGCALTAERAETPRDIVDAAIEAGTFNTLVAVIQAADLMDLLKSPGPFTVFAPTDAAFAALPEGAVATLLKPGDRDRLVAILTYHMIPGALTSAELAGEVRRIPTLQGATIVIDATSGFGVNGANVVAADIDASNGVIHAIDKVILPPE